ncbi:DUF2474 domain-containing protein [Lysobacter sp. A289]
MPREPGRRWWSRIGWLALIWVLSVASLTLVALLLKLVMRSAGMTT